MMMCDVHMALNKCCDLKANSKLNALYSIQCVAVISPFYYGFIRPDASRQQVVPVVEQLVVFAAVSNPQVRHARNAAGQTQQVLLCAAVLVSDEQTLICCFTLQTKGCKRYDHHRDQ